MVTLQVNVMVSAINVMNSHVNLGREIFSCFRGQVALRNPLLRGFYSVRGDYEKTIGYLYSVSSLMVILDDFCRCLRQSPPP